MATKLKKQSATNIGWELGEVRQQLKELQVRNLSLTKAFKIALGEEKVTEAGGYRIRTDTTLTVADMESAWKWSEQYPAVRKIDITLTREIFRKGQGDPTKYGFEYVESEKVVSVKDADKDL